MNIEEIILDIGLGFKFKDKVLHKALNYECNRISRAEFYLENAVRLELPTAEYDEVIEYHQTNFNILAKELNHIYKNDRMAHFVYGLRPLGVKE